MIDCDLAPAAQAWNRPSHLAEDELVMVEGEQQRGDLRMISELLDGKLRGAERAAAVRRIESDEALYEVFVETARYRDSRSPLGLALLRRHGGKRALWGGLLVATVGLALLLPGLRSEDPLAPQVLASELVAGGLGETLSREGWFEPRRGLLEGAAVTTGPGDGLSFRTGVLTLDLEVALRARQRASAATLAHRLAGRIDSLDAALAADYARLGDRLEATAPDRAGWRGSARLSARLARSVGESAAIDPLLLAFGRWCEAGRLAADGGNVALLTSTEFRGFLASLFERADWSPPVVAELERLEDLLQDELNELQVTAIGVSFEAILAQG